MERLLQINILTLAMLATCMVGLGQHDAMLPFLVLLCGAVSFWLTDVANRFSLNQTVANIAGGVILLLLLPGIIELDRRVIITSVAKLLIYLQVVLMFRRKDPRTYFHLIRLTLLQVVVAAVLTQGTFFGLLLLIYLFTGLSALVLLFLHSERCKYAATEHVIPAPDGAAAAAAIGPTGAVERWPLAGQAPTLTVGPIGRADIESEFFTRLLRMGLFSLALSVVVFFAMPRMHGGAWRGPASLLRPTVGYTDRITLGDLGNVLQNPTEVMQVRLLQEPEGRPAPIRREIYLLGTLLANYDHGAAGGDWQEFFGINPAPACPPGRNMLYQRILAAPGREGRVFCIWPYHIPPFERNMVMEDTRTGKPIRTPAAFHQRQNDLTLGTTAFFGGIQSPVVPNHRRIVPAQRNILLQLPKRQGDPATPELIALTKQWIAEGGLRNPSQHTTALFLERRLRDSGRFTYSLAGCDRDPDLDPIEDFVTKHPTGHCEYFASALTLMLRSQGIPAALAVGYKTDEYSPRDGSYQVRQLHAHAWVEVYLTADQVPAEAKSTQPDQDWSEGAWMRLDPTPGSDQGSGFWMSDLGRSFDRFEFAWSRYVLDMDSSRQRSDVYDPLSALVQKTLANAANPDWWKGLFRNDARVGGSEGTWFHWQAFTVIFGGGAVLVLSFGIYHFYLAGWLQQRADEAAGRSHGGRSRVAFYRRLEAILERCGLICPASTTQREFAQHAAQTLAAWDNGAELARIPVQLVELFYSVRFGASALDKTRAEAVEKALRTLERAVTERRMQAEAERRKSL